MAPEVDSDDENVEYEDESGHRYRLYLDELEEGTGGSHGNGPADSASLQGKNKKMILMEKFIFYYFIKVCYFKNHKGIL